MYVQFQVAGVNSCTVRLREIGTCISEASKRVPIFLHDVRGGKQMSFYFGLGHNLDKDVIKVLCFLLKQNPPLVYPIM
jgi:hypothetical protein